VGILSQQEERRASRRVRLDQIREVTGIRICSESVEVINASRGGLLVDSELRLAPGTQCRVEILWNETPVRVRARVLRCRVVVLSATGLRYQIALGFDTPLDFLDSEDGRRDPHQATALVSDAFSQATDDASAIDLDPALACNNW
jgi:hypothetical protein